MNHQIKRLFAHIVATFIIDKYKSKRVKRIIEYGVFKRMKEIKEMRKNQLNNKCKYDLAVVAIMKNEGPYLKEWIEFHKLVGVQKFYLYDNESDDDTRKILEPYIKQGLVDYTFFPGQKMQLPAYNDCIKKHKNETKWLAVIDLDEYIVPVKDDSILPLLNEQKDDVAQIIIPWVIFGSNGHENKPNGLVLESYTKRAKHSWLYKSIIKPNLVFNMGVHEHNVAGMTKSMPISKIRIHHYHCKSWEEYAKKAAKGDVYNGADAGIRKYQRECFNRHDLNDVVDTTAIRFVDKLKGI